MHLYLSVNSSGSDTGSEHSARDSCDIEEGLHVTLGGSEKSQPILVSVNVLYRAQTEEVRHPSFRLLSNLCT